MKHYLEYQIELEEIAGKQFGTINHLSEAIWESVMSWDCGDHIYKYGRDYLHGTYGDYEEGLEILSKQLNPPLTSDEIARHKDEIESDILRALAEAYRNNYETGIYEEIKNAVEVRQNELGASGFYCIDMKGKPCGFYEASSVVFYYSKAQFDKTILPDALENEYIDNKSALRDYAEREYCFEQWHEMINPGAINWELFDYHGGRFDSEGWQELLKDYAECLYTIEKEREAKKKKLKEMIKNHVPLGYRAAELETLNA